MKLSVLDQSPVPEGFSAADALSNSIELARLADSLGYQRYWIAEHHATATLASSAPEILMTRIAAETTAIRVGSGAVLLPHYAPMKVAEVFRTLHALYPNRIDLGLGRAPGGGGREALALQRVRGMPFGDDFLEQLEELRAFLGDGFPDGHRFAPIRLSPEMPGAPELWLLGSSTWSAQTAADERLPYAFAHFINPASTRAAIEHYRAHAAAAVRDRTVLALGVVCADTEQEALRQFASTRYFGRNIAQGQRRPVPETERAVRKLGLSREESDRELNEWPRYAVGTPEQVREQLQEIASALAIDELMIWTVVHDHAARLRSYQLTAEAFDIAPRPDGAAPMPQGTSPSD